VILHLFGVDRQTALSAGEVADVRALLEEHGGRLESQQRQLEELAERQDFAERLLAQARRRACPGRRPGLMQVTEVPNPQVVVNAIMPLAGIGATLLFAGFVTLGPVGRAIGRVIMYRLGGEKERALPRPSFRMCEDCSTEQGGRLDAVQRQVSDLAERQDFAERLLAQVRDQPRLPGAKHGAGETLMAARVGGRRPQGVTMISREDLEGFIARLEAEGVHAREVEPGCGCSTRNGDGRTVAVPLRAAGPVVLARQGDDAAQESCRSRTLYLHLLELNAKDLVHGSYGVDAATSSCPDTLELEQPRLQRVQASFESMTLSLASHLATLGRLTGKREAIWESLTVCPRSSGRT